MLCKYVKYYIKRNLYLIRYTEISNKKNSVIDICFMLNLLFHSDGLLTE